MDRNANDDINKPLLLAHESSNEGGEFYDANSSIRTNSAYFSTLSSPPQQQQSQPATNTTETTTAATSYYGRVSRLSTGMLFPSTRGIVDTLPHPTKPCLLFADHDPLAAVAHICLLEKEVYSCSVCSAGALLPMNPKLFTVVHVCEPLAKHEDAGTRILKKINKHSTMKLPVLLNEGNIFQEGDSSESGWSSSLSCLLPEYIDAVIGKKNLLRPEDAVGLYNMKLFIQKHSQLPSLFHQLLTHTSPTHRIQLSTQLLNLLKLINADLQTFEGPYLCGTQFTLADIYLFPIIERIVVVLSTYRSFWIPPSLTYLINWYDTVADRPSVRVATSDRTLESQNTYCYERIHRNEYLIEVYECYARHEEVLFQELNDERGSPGVNVYRQVVEEDMRDRRICERRSCQNCVIS